MEVFLVVLIKKQIEFVQMDFLLVWEIRMMFRFQKMDLIHFEKLLDRSG